MKATKEKWKPEYTRYFLGISGMTEDVLDLLRQTAEREGRSLSAQVMQILKHWAIGEKARKR